MQAMQPGHKGLKAYCSFQQQALSPYSPQEFTSWLRDCSCHGQICRRDLVWAAPVLLVHKPWRKAAKAAQRHEPRQEGDSRSRHAHRVRATLLNSSLGVTGKIFPPLLCRLACQPHLSCCGGWVWGRKDSGSGPEWPHVLRVCIQYQGPSPVLSIGRRGRLGARLHTSSGSRGSPQERAASPGSRCGQPNWALQPTAISPANGSEKETSPKRLAEGCGFCSVDISSGSTGDLH